MNSPCMAQADEAANAQMDEREREICVEAKATLRRLGQLEKVARDLKALLEDGGPVTASLTGQVEDLDEDMRDLRLTQYRLVAHALDFRYSPFDIQAWCDQAMELGAAHPQLGQALISDLVRLRRVPNAPFRAKVAELLSKGESEHDIAVSIYRQFKSVGLPTLGLAVEEEGLELHGQPRALARLLGTEVTTGRWTSLRLFISYEQGVALARALGISPHEAGV